MRLICMFIAAAGLIVSCDSAKKTNGSNYSPALTGTYWKLTELSGRPVTQPSQTGKEMYITLNAADSTVQGNGGCNSFSGKFSSAEGNRIGFKGLMATLMACPDIALESEFMKAVETADSYNVTGNSLQLNRARMAPLAKFEAVKK